MEAMTYNKVTAIYPGTFDPITKGHVDLVERSSAIFHKIIVAVATNTKKAPLLSLEKRVELTKIVLTKYLNIEVCSFSGLLVDLAKQKNAHVILRGLRAVTDFEYELQLADINRHLDKSIETIFLIPSDQYSYISSSMVREIASLHGDISNFVHPQVMQTLKVHYSKARKKTM